MAFQNGHTACICSPVPISPDGTGFSYLTPLHNTISYFKSASTTLIEQTISSDMHAIREFLNRLKGR